MDEVPSWLFSMEEKNNASHMFIAIDISKFMDINLFNKRMENTIAYLHSRPKAKDNSKIFYPGEIEWGKYDLASNNGLTLPKDVEESLLGLERESEILINWD